MRAINEDVLISFVFAHYHQVLKSSDRAMRFLHATGFDRTGLIQDLYLGFSDRTLGYQLAGASSASGAAVRGMLVRQGLLKSSGHEYLRGCVIFPLRSDDGTVIGSYGFRLRDFEQSNRLVPVSWVREPSR